MPQEDLCYARRAEEAVPSIKAAWAQNFGVVDWGSWSKQLTGELSEAGGAGHAVRGHVGGEFLRPLTPGSNIRVLDRKYVAAVLWAIYRASPRPAIFFYTHAWREMASHLRFFQRLGVEMFASVHCPEDGWAARALGYRLAIDGGERPDGKVPAWKAWVNGGIPALICPEQRLGHEIIDCSSCGYCFRKQRHHGDVMFMRHGMGTVMGKTGGKHVE
jgi:hypothetical protein